AMPCPTSTSTCRNFMTISSGLCRFVAMSILRSPKHNGGPLHWGRITEKQSIVSINVARGSEGPRALLAYYYAFLHTKTKFTDSVQFPVVVDSPNQQGQDKVHLPQMVKFIFDHVPDDAQTIVATEDASVLDVKDVTIATYGEAKRQVLREREFDRVKAIFDPFFQKILEMD
ncbi:hypothetical protein OEZ60_21545, partial [Defluviimonas sp. WL0024]